MSAAVWPGLVAGGAMMLLGGLGWLVREAFRRQEASEKVRRDREAAAELERRKNDPVLQQVVAEQVKDLFVRYEERIKALEERDRERERKLAQVEEERDGLKRENQRLTGRLSELERRVRELEAEKVERRSAAERTRRTDGGA